MTDLLEWFVQKLDIKKSELLLCDSVRLHKYLIHFGHVPLSAMYNARPWIARTLIFQAQNKKKIFFRIYFNYFISISHLKRQQINFGEKKSFDP